MMLRVPGKNGKRRKRIGHFAVDHVRKVMTIQFRDSWIKNIKGKRQVAFPNPVEFDDFKFRRCLGHISLNYVAWKFGWDTALERRFDPLRKYVRYGTRNMMWPYGQVSYKDSEPRKKLNIGWLQGAPGLTIKLESYIDDFYIDVLNTGDLEQWMRSYEGKEVFYFGE
jgi:hypothetical protein